MSAGSVVAGASPLARLRALRLPADSVGLRLTLGSVAVLLAYHYSLLTLVRDLGLDTPLAYLGLVPLVAVGIALLLPARPEREPDIHDRQLDLILGLPVVAGTVIALNVLPERMSALFWTSRIDLLTLPFFVAGVAVLLFGLRATWRYRVPIGFLFLAWPLPYTWLLDHTLTLTTDSTIAGIRQALTWLTFAVPAPGGDGSLFRVLHGGANGAGNFTVSIASACAGVNSLVGFVIVGTAFLAVVRPKPRRDGTLRGRGLTRKLTWLTLGLLMVFVMNIARLMLVLGVGKAYGQGIAIDGLHPVIGLVSFSLAVVVMLVVMPAFGLQVVPPTQRATPAAQQRTLERWIQRATTPPSAARGLRLSGIAVVAASGLLVSTNSSFAHYELVAGDLTTARLEGFAQQPSAVPGFTAVVSDHYDWVRQFFGSSSTWDRFEYTSNGSVSIPTLASLSAQPIIADVIEGTSLRPFNAYGIEACYLYHGYDTSDEQRIDLGSGVYGDTTSFRDQSQGVTRNVVYWVWPVQTPAGKRYERVTLIQQDGGDTADQIAANPNPFAGVGVANAVGSNVKISGTNRLRAAEPLIAFARAVVAHEAPAPAISVVTASGTGK